MSYMFRAGAVDGARARAATSQPGLARRRDESCPVCRAAVTSRLRLFHYDAMVRGCARARHRPGCASERACAACHIALRAPRKTGFPGIVLIEQRLLKRASRAAIRGHPRVTSRLREKPPEDV